MVCIDKSTHVHHRDFGRRTKTLYKGWAGRTKNVCKGFVGPVPQNVVYKAVIGPAKAERLCTKFESTPRNICALHQVFVCSKALSTQRIGAPRSLHTDNPNGSGIVVLNNSNTMNMIHSNKRSVTYTWAHRQTNGHGIPERGENQNERTVYTM